MEFIIGLFKKDKTRRVIILLFLGIILYLMRSMLNLFLLTFIFTFLMSSVQGFISDKLKNFIHVGQRILIIVLYVILAFFVIFGLYKFLPSIIDQSKTIINMAVEYYKKPGESEIEKYIMSLLNQINLKDIDLKDYIRQGLGILLTSISSLSKLGFDIFLALVLSLFFLLEKSRIARFTLSFKTSKLSLVYNEVEFFAKKFTNSFGKVIEAQFIIAFVNCILSTIALWFMHFPQVLGLGIMIFILGLIPVAGVWISLIPLCAVALSEGGIKMVIYVLIMIVVLHALEAYVLNPKLMSSKTHMPVFYTFVVLLISEHIFGVWGLIIGLPIFMFILDLLEINRE